MNYYGMGPDRPMQPLRPSAREEFEPYEDRDSTDWWWAGALAVLFVLAALLFAAGTVVYVFWGVDDQECGECSELEGW